MQHINTKRWVRYGQGMECYQAQRRCLITLKLGLIIGRNRIHLRKRLASCAAKHHNRSFPGTSLGNKKDGRHRIRQA